MYNPFHARLTEAHTRANIQSTYSHITYKFREVLPIFCLTALLSLKFEHMAIHFKFKSAKQYDSIDIGGDLSSLSVLDLKNAISLKKGLLGQDYDLVLANAQTEEGK